MDAVMEVGRPYSRLLRRLEAVVELGDEERSMIARLPMQVRNLAAGQTVASEGDIPTFCTLILDGFLFRQKIAKAARRQIISFHIPGDIVDLQSLHLGRVDHNICCLGQAVVAMIPHPPLKDMLDSSSRLTHAFWRETLIDAAIFREWVISLGQRDALARVAHIICEIMMRLQAVGLARDLSFSVPWTQTDLADAAGISAVHTNRVVQELRRLELLDMDSRQIVIRDWDGLKRAADFNPDYLHLRRQEGGRVLRI